MLCFMCKSSLSNFEKLMFHFKHSHNLNSNSPIRCVNCGQMFTVRSRFKRHVTRHHLNEQSDSINNENINFLDSINKLNSLSGVDIPSSSKTTPIVSTNILQTNLNNFSDITIDHKKENTHQNFNFDAYIKKITNLALQFSLALHNNDNFSRKKVIEIQEYVNLYIINPLLDTFTDFAKSTFLFEQPSLYNTFPSLVFNLKNPFKLFNSEYKLFKFLTNEEVIDNLKEVTINDQIMPAHRIGKLENKQVITKGILMPLKFQFKTVFEKNNLLHI